jgi:hypothetical protein
LTALKSPPADQKPRPKSARGGKKRGRTLLAVLVAAASLVVVVGATADLDRHPPATTPTTIPTPAGPDRGQPTAALTITQVLLQAGAAAGNQPGGWPEASFWHSASSYRQGSGPLVAREVWAGHQGIGSLVDTRLSKDVIPLQDGRFAGMTWDELYALPTESDALESHLRANGLDGVRDADTELFALVGDLLRESPAPPALRKALWEVAARVPGTSLVGSVKDGSGRSGVAISRGDHGYVLNPGDGRLFEESIGASPPSNGSPGGAQWRATYLEQGPCETAPPPAPARSGPAAENT